jgi:hypothetical protein
MISTCLCGSRLMWLAEGQWSDLSMDVTWDGVQMLGMGVGGSLRGAAEEVNVGEVFGCLGLTVNL